jgi:hygromycin-B 4-O-kinase
VSELRPDVSLSQVEAFLRDHESTPPENVCALKPGELSRVFAYDLAGEPRVIRFNPKPDAFEADRTAHDRFARPGLPIPRVLEIGQHGALWFAISERLPGRIMWDITPEQYDAALPSLCDAHDLIAAIDPGPDLPGGWLQWLDSFEADHDSDNFWRGWRDLFDTTFLERDRWEALHARFRGLLPAAQDPRLLVHGDFGQDNVLIDGPRVTAVLDWGPMRRGDPLWDLAYIGFWSGRIGAQLSARYGDLPDYQARVTLYQLRMVLDATRFYARTNQRPAYDFVLGRAATL